MNSISPVRLQQSPSVRFGHEGPDHEHEAPKAADPASETPPSKEAPKPEKESWKTVLLYPFVIQTPSGWHPVAYKALALLNWPRVLYAKIKGEI